MMMYHDIIILYLIAINVIAYVLMWYDKFQSKHKGSRISENTLFIIAVIFGALGIYLGMKAPIYHKAAKAKFKWGIPFLIALNIVCIYLIGRYK
jgi:uncharacterized membrane protein YsdA (DUF1294 family)